MTEPLQVLAAEIAARVPQIEAVESCKPLLGGACQDNFALVVRTPAGREKLALRSDAVTSLPGSINRESEFAVIEAARGAGVPTPRARWLTRDLLRPGSSAYFLDWVEGLALGGKVVRSVDFEEPRRRLPQQLAQALARLHSVAELPSQAAPVDPVEAALAFQREALDRLPHRRPGFELVARWLHENRPAERPVCLVHGDFRVGNFMVSQQGLEAVLDWEFSHLGDPLEDIGWLCVRDWRFGVLHKPAGGLCARAEFCRLYQEAGGVQVDPELLHYWEVFGNLRWGAGALAQGLRYSASDPQLELLAIARRAAEMEYEALRLIEVGPERW